MRRSLEAFVPIAIVIGWVLSFCPLAGAQEAVLNQMYGNGVHAFFTQDYVKAHQYFTSAIDARSQDPRCYYFRGLTDAKLGRPQDAELDFKEGAKLETNVDQSRSFGVARSLERIQGPERATLEQFRLEARAAILKKVEQQNRVRYEVDQKQTRDFLDAQAKGADKVEQVELPAQPKAANVDPFNPTGAAAPDMKKDEAKPDAAPAADKPAVTPPAAEKPAEEPKPADSTPAPAEPATPKAEVDPFGTPGAATPAPKKAAAKPAETKPAETKTGGAASDAANPFGTDNAAPPAAAKDDAAPATPAASKDAPAKDAPAKNAPAKDAPPAKEADPFG